MDIRHAQNSESEQKIVNHLFCAVKLIIHKNKIIALDKVFTWILKVSQIQPHYTDVDDNAMCY